MRRFLNQISKYAGARTLPASASFHQPRLAAAPVSDVAALAFVSGRHGLPPSTLEADAASQACPGHAGKLGGARDDDAIAVRARQKTSKPRARMGYNWQKVVYQLG